ncbi:MAG: hypothetical protein KGL39_55135 [Patescibacteria group bacterium]|nr:hypothetical protein [Patescibacteria group bacterium]
MLDLVAPYKAEIKRRIETWPQHTNRASSLGHPCERHLTYCRTASEKRQKPSVELQQRFEDGKLHEDAVLRILEDARVEREDGHKARLLVMQRQRDLSIDPFFRTHQISGHPDAMVAVEDDPAHIYPVDCKSCSQYVYGRLNTLTDMQRDKSAYVRSYPAQLQLYCLGTGEPEGAFLLKDKNSGDVKQIDVPLDYDYAEQLVQKADRINAHVAAGTLPEPIDDGEVCQSCDFRHICPVDINYGPPLRALDDPEVIDKLNLWERLKPLAKEFEAIDKEVKALFAGEPNLIVGDFHIASKPQHRDGYTVKPTDFYTTKIVRIQGESTAQLTEGVA